jgi:hypothetical protein
MVGMLIIATKLWLIWCKFEIAATEEKMNPSCWMTPGSRIHCKMGIWFWSWLSQESLSIPHFHNLNRSCCLLGSINPRCKVCRISQLHTPTSEGAGDVGCVTSSTPCYHLLDENQDQSIFCHPFCVSSPLSCPLTCEYRLVWWYVSLKGSPVHVAPACARSEEGSDHYGSYVCSTAFLRKIKLSPILLFWGPETIFSAY